MKKSLVLLLLALLTLSGCYYQLPDDASPIGEVLSSPRPSGDIPSNPSNTPQGTIYAQNVNVANCGFTWRVNSVKVTKDAAEVAEDGPLADYMENFKPIPTMSEAFSYMLVNMTISNPFAKQQTVHLRNLKLSAFNERSIPALLQYETDWFGSGVWAFDKTQHPKSIYYWYYTMEPGETMTADYLFILDDFELEQNLFLALYDWEGGAFNQITHENTRFILLHTAEESTLLSIPKTEDTPPPETMTTVETPDFSDEYYTSKEKLKPGQIFQKGEEVSQFDLLFRLTGTEVIPDFQGVEWYPLESKKNKDYYLIYTNRVTLERFQTPDFEPCVVMLNLTVKNPSDTPVTFDFSNTVAILALNKDNTLSTSGLESQAFDLNPLESFEQGSNYWKYELGAREELTYTIACLCDIAEMERMRGQELCLMLNPNISAAKVITFRLEE